MSTTLPALSDINTPLPGVTRIETQPFEAMIPHIQHTLPSTYSHADVFGDYCTVQDFIACPPDELFQYLADTRSLEEWTYSLRGFTETDEARLWKGYDRLGSQTEIYARTVANTEARTVDYHCAWDQGKHLWMIYLMRVIDAQLVLNKPGSVVLWTNCHHPFYDRNPYPETAPADRKPWVGDFWHLFAAGHLLELHNLKAIAEYRYAHKLPIKPNWMNARS